MRFGGSLLALAILTGCDDSRPLTYPVSGTIEFGDGTPVRFGTVEFIPEKTGASARGKIDQQGRFTLGTFVENDGATAGRHQVIVIQHFSPTPGQPTSELHEQEHHDDLSIVDLRYSQLDLSPLTAMVAEKENRIKFRVERSTLKRTKSVPTKKRQPGHP